MKLVTRSFYQRARIDSRDAEGHEEPGEARSLRNVAADRIASDVGVTDTGRTSNNKFV